MDVERHRDAAIGLPVHAQLGFNPANNGDSRNPVRPSWNPAFSGPVILGGPNQYFNPNAFVLPPRDLRQRGTGHAERPGTGRARFFRHEHGECHGANRLQFRAEFFNILNRANFGTPNAVVFTSATTAPSPTAGVITATSTTSRQIQFGLKLLW